jgi:glycogen debranching enzyme
MRGDIITMAWGVKGTSAITQPPLLARALWEVFILDRDTSFIKEFYPVLRTHYSYLLRERTFGNRYLLHIINPDESGEDNSPRFDAAQGLPPQHVAIDNLEKRITRMLQNARCNFDARTCMRTNFAIADVSFNVIFTDSLGCLAAIADILGYKQDNIFFEEQKKLCEQAIRAHLHVENGEFYSYDDRTKSPIKVKTWNLFMPLYGGLVTDSEARHLVEDLLLDEREFWPNWPIPSTALSEPSFDGKDGFWRGPVWIAPNWFVYRGLLRYGYKDVAKELARKTRKLIESNGFREHYTPDTGEGIGAHDFTWGGLILDME